MIQVSNKRFLFSTRTCIHKNAFLIYKIGKKCALKFQRCALPHISRETKFSNDNKTHCFNDLIQGYCCNNVNQVHYPTFFNMERTNSPPLLILFGNSESVAFFNYNKLRTLFPMVTLPTIVSVVKQCVQL